MSARVKYGSAFSPVIPSKSTLNHPFSIKNLLNLDDKIGVDSAEESKTFSGLPNASSARETDLPIARPATEDGSTATVNFNLTAANLWPAWVYATRYSRQGIPPGSFKKQQIFLFNFIVKNDSQKFRPF